MDEEATLRLEPATANAPWIDSGLELLVVDPQQRESIWPVCKASMQIGSARNTRPNEIILDGPDVADRQAVLQYRKQKVMFLNFVEAQPATKAGQVITYGEFSVGEEIELCGHRMRLLERQISVASLVGYSHPYRGRRWLLRQGTNSVGRPGRRDNQVVVDDRTVSRTHATLSESSGRFSLQVDTDSTPTFVNGHPVVGSVDLKDGDLLQVGAQILRFQLGKVTTSMETRHATVLFADIGNYEKLVESRPLDEFVRQMGDFYEMVDRVVTEQHGLLTTYLGDAVVAIFEDGTVAVGAASGLCQNIDQMNQLWQQIGLPALEIGIGIHTGEIVLGDLSLRGRSEFAAVGEQANLAAQIEKQNRRKGTRILLSQATAQAVGNALPLRSLGSTQLGMMGRVELFTTA